MVSELIEGRRARGLRPPLPGSKVKAIIFTSRIETFINVYKRLQTFHLRLTQKKAVNCSWVGGGSPRLPETQFTNWVTPFARNSIYKLGNPVCYKLNFQFGCPRLLQTQFPIWMAPVCYKLNFQFGCPPFARNSIYKLGNPVCYKINFQFGWPPFATNSISILDGPRLLETQFPIWVAPRLLGYP